MKDITYGFALSMLLTTLMFSMSLSLFAQGENPTVIKKTVEIKKIVDENGNETIETIETEVEVNAEEWGEIEGEFDIDIEETIENGIKKRIVRVQAGDESGKLPQEMRDELESMGININIIEGSQQRTIIIDSDEEHAGEEGDHDIQIFKIAPGEELPEDVRKELEKQGINIEEIRNERHRIKHLHLDDFEGKGDRTKILRKENNTTIDRQTQIFRIANIDDLDNEIIAEITKMGISQTELRERFDAAENTLRIYKEGLQDVEVEVDAPMSQQQMFFMGEEVIEVNPDMDFQWIEKKQDEVRIPRIATTRGYLGVSLDEDATILSVKPESPAADAGLEAHDRLIQIGAIQVKTADEVIAAMEKALPGTNTDVIFQRGDVQQTVTVVPTMPPHREHRMKRNTCSPDDKSRWMERMKADCEKRCNTPFLGIYMEEKDRDFEEYKVKITGIVQNTGAEDAGILEDDILLKVNRAPISNVQDVVDEISKYEPGDAIKVHVLRGGKKKRIKATLSNQTQADIFSPCDCSTGEINTDAMTTREIILIKENSAADIPRISIDTNAALNLDEIDLFPNPNNGIFTIRFATANKVPTTITVIDVNGKEVYRQDLQDFNGRYDNRVNISNQARGTYFLNIIQGEKIYTEQFVFGKK